MSNIPQNFTWRDENGDKLECSEKLRLLHENEAELTQMAQDIFEDGLAMGVSKENMNEAMKRLLRHLSASFSLLALFFNNAAFAQVQQDQAPSPTPTAAAQLPAQPSSIPPAAALPTPTNTTDAGNNNTVTTLPASTTPTLPMRATPETPPTLLPAPLLYPANSWEGRSVGIIRILDRVTSETKELEIPVGTTVTFHRLTLRLYACNQKPTGLPSDTAIRLGLSEIPLKTDENGEIPLQRQFEGWFLAAEPAANIYPSPLYNIQAVRCAGDPAPPMLPPLIAIKAIAAPDQAAPTVIPDAADPVSEPPAQPTLTPGTPPPGNLALPTVTAATASDLPFASNPTDEKSKKKKKHKHHHHGKSEDKGTSILEDHLDHESDPPASNGNATT